jgi:RNA recognition motif. (a.k.a. RRM, RBD, or RNP domain)
VFQREQLPPVALNCNCTAQCLQQLTQQSTALLAQVRIARDKRRRRCRGYGYVRFRTSEQANAAVESMRRFQFKEGRFLGALPSDENRTLFVGGLAESWSADTVKALLTNALSGVRR